MTRSIVLSDGFTITLDDDDMHLLGEYTWHARQNGRKPYVYRKTDVGGKTRTIYLHRVVTNAPRGMQVDHRDGNPLNNTRANLRIVTATQNGQNRRGAQINSKTGVRNVFYRPDRDHYIVRVVVNGRKHYCGSFASLEDAANAARDARQRLLTHAVEHDDPKSREEVGNESRQMGTVDEARWIRGTRRTGGAVGGHRRAPAHDGAGRGHPVAAGAPD